MKIALIPSCILPTPPKNYGGAEKIVSDLGDALIAKGHSVTLFAPRGSYIEGADLVETGIAPETTSCDWAQLESNAFLKYQDRLKEFDIIHDHTWFYFAALRKSDDKLNMIHTHHGHLDWKAAGVPDFIKPTNLISISDHMKAEYLNQGWASERVYNGINLDAYPFQQKKGDRLIFVGRADRFKAPDLAIRAAIENNTPIDMVCGTFVGDKQYLESIKVMCDNSKGLATFYPDASHAKKTELLGEARGCLVPSKMREPYGLVAAESLAMGTPVVCLADGALPEIVNSLSCGFVCPNDAMFINAIRLLRHGRTEANPKACRARAECFSREIMADNYLEVYKRVIGGEGW